MTADDLVGVRFGEARDWGISPGLTAKLVFRNGAIDIPEFTMPHELWRALEALVIVPRARTIAAQLLDGAEVRIGDFRLTRGGLRHGAVTARWDEIEGLVFRPEGFLVGLKNRPQDSVLVRPNTLCPVPMLPMIAATLVPAEAEEDDDAPPVEGAPYRGDAVAAPGGTGHELGDAVFAYRSSFVANLVVILSVAFLLALVATIGGACLLGDGHEALVGEGLAATFSLLGVTIFLDVARRVIGDPARGTGRDFTVHDGGIDDRRGALRWRDVASITLSATRRYVNGQYRSTTYAFAASGAAGGRRRAFRISGQGPKFEAYFSWFERTVLPRLAERDVGRMQAGETVSYAGVTADQHGLRKGSASIGWPHARARVQAGRLDVSGIDVDLNRPNARLLLAVLAARGVVSRG